MQNVDLNQNLSKTFTLIEENKNALNIESYFLSHTTLEQVFMSFANLASQSTNQYSISKNNKEPITISSHYDSRESLNYSINASNECILVSYSANNQTRDFAINSKLTLKL